MAEELIPPGPGAKIFKQVRLRREWSMNDVAERLGVTKTAVSYWEMGSSWPTDRNLDNLCVLFDLNYDDMLELKPDSATLLALKQQRGHNIRTGGIKRNRYVRPGVELLSRGNIDRSTNRDHGFAYSEE